MTTTHDAQSGDGAARLQQAMRDLSLSADSLRPEFRPLLQRHRFHRDLVRRTEAYQRAMKRAEQANRAMLEASKHAGTPEGDQASLEAFGRFAEPFARWALAHLRWLGCIAEIARAEGDTRAVELVRDLSLQRYRYDATELDRDGAEAAIVRWCEWFMRTNVGTATP